MRNMRKTNPTLYEELTLPNRQKLPEISEPQPEDKDEDARQEEEEVDECNLSIPSVRSAITQQVVPAGMGARASGVLVSTVEAENLDFQVEPPIVEGKDGDGVREQSGESSTGRGKRKKMPNKLYSASSFWRHDDNEDSGSEN